MDCENITPSMHTTPCNTKHDQFTTICLNPSFFVAIPLSGLGNFPWQPRIHAIRRAGSSILGSAAIRSRIQIIPTISCSVKRAIGTVWTTTLWPAAVSLRIHSARAILAGRTTTLWPAAIATLFRIHSARAIRTVRTTSLRYAAVSLTPLRIRTARAIRTVRTTTLRPAAIATLFRIHSARAIGTIRTYTTLWPAAVTLTPLGIPNARAIGSVRTTTKCRPWPAAIRISLPVQCGQSKLRPCGLLQWHQPFGSEMPIRSVR